MDGTGYANIRKLLGGVIGKTVADVSQHDVEDFDPESGKGAFVMLMFTDSSTLKVNMGDEPLEFEDAAELESED